MNNNLESLVDILRVEGVRSKGFGIIPKLVMQDKRISVASKGIYAYFCSYAGAGDTAFPSVKKICYDLNINCEDTFRKHMKPLKHLGYIKVEQQKCKDEFGRLMFSKNIYTLIDKPETQEQQDNFPSPKFSGTETFRHGNFPTRKKQGYNNNSVLKSTGDLKSTEKNNNNTKNTVVVENISISSSKEDKTMSDPIILKEKIQKTINATISLKCVKDLLAISSPSNIVHYLNNWDKFLNSNIKNVSGFFVKCVKENWDLPKELKIKSQNEVPQHHNFEQRTYSDEEFESFYANIKPESRVKNNF